MTEDEWGPWIEHDGKGCPCVGQWVHCVYCAPPPSGVVATWHGYTQLPDGSVIGIAYGGPSWGPFVGYEMVVPIIRYRVRKPRAMALIRALLENLPERVDA